MMHSSAFIAPLNTSILSLTYSVLPFVHICYTVKSDRSQGRISLGDPEYIPVGFLAYSMRHGECLAIRFGSLEPQTSDVLCLGVQISSFVRYTQPGGCGCHLGTSAYSLSEHLYLPSIHSLHAAFCRSRVNNTLFSSNFPHSIHHVRLQGGKVHPERPGIRVLNHTSRSISC